MWKRLGEGGSGGGGEWKKKRGISHLASQRREVGDTKRLRREPEGEKQTVSQRESERERELRDVR